MAKTAQPVAFKLLDGRGNGRDSGGRPRYVANWRNRSYRRTSGRSSTIAVRCGSGPSTPTRFALTGLGISGAGVDVRQRWGLLVCR